MSQSNMQKLGECGQSIWLDYIDRPLLETGKLKGMIENGLRGMTSNPSIFNNAIGNSTDYDQKIGALKASGKSTFEIYDALTIADIQEAADQFRGVYDETSGLDGYVSLEINPQLANEVGSQIDEGLRLWRVVERQNVMIKVPSTEAGLKVVEELIANGVNVNVTLIFSVQQYAATAKAYFRGLSRLADSGGDLSKVHSVASVFISRTDTAVDNAIAEKFETASDADKVTLQALQGKAAVANSRIIWETWKELYASEDAKALEEKNANVQRVLWASTGTKNPEYSDIKYVTELISNPSVNTLPEKTLNAFLDHGEVKEALSGDVQEARNVVATLKTFSIDIDQVTETLLEQGVDAFDDAFDQLFDSIETKAQQLANT